MVGISLDNYFPFIKTSIASATTFAFSRDRIAYSSWAF